MFDEIHLLELAPTSLVRGLLEDDNLSTLKTIHILTGQILFGQGDLSYPMNWEDLHRIIELVILIDEGDDIQTLVYYSLLHCLQSIKVKIENFFSISDARGTPTVDSHGRE
ncbi:MAG: hypothetical protein L6R37_006003 [Teloschistes peruensis]|nr:MAG: hypothetical protein L6R37_006003 [Teloschistes peruensis]